MPALTMKNPALKNGTAIADVTLELRPGNSADASACTEICYEAFKTISDYHRFPPDFPSPDPLHGFMPWLFARSDVYSVVAEVAGQKALIGAAKSFEGPGFLLPSRNSELFRWCLQKGLHVVQPLTLMSLGLYHQPQGAFLPSILF